MAEKVTSWKATDGTLWDSEEIADHHSATIAIERDLRALADEICFHNMTAQDLGDALVENRGKLFDILFQLEAKDVKP